MPKGHERKKCMPKDMKKRKERNKDSPYFQNKGIHPKERYMIQGVPKIFRIGTLFKFHTLARLDLSV